MSDANSEEELVIRSSAPVTKIGSDNFSKFEDRTFKDAEMEIIHQKIKFRAWFFNVFASVIFALFVAILSTVFLGLYHLNIRDLFNQLHWVVVIFSTLCVTATVLTIVFSKAILTHVNEEKKSTNEPDKSQDLITQIFTNIKTAAEALPIIEALKSIK